jgi:hypothetical protein
MPDDTLSESANKLRKSSADVVRAKLENTSEGIRRSESTLLGG